MIQLRKHGKFVPALLSFWNEACFEGDCGSFFFRDILCVLEKYGERQKIMEQSEVVRKLRNVVCGLR